MCLHDLLTFIFDTLSYQFQILISLFIKTLISSILITIEFFHVGQLPQGREVDFLTGTRIRTNSDSSNNTSHSSNFHSLPYHNGINVNNNNNNNNNKTIMPPPKSIPSNRPHSTIFTPRSSPPRHSPLSPPSYSTESDGSSISIDEPDFSTHCDEHIYLEMK